MLMRENEEKMLSMLMTTKGTQITVKVILWRKPTEKNTTIFDSLFILKKSSMVILSYRFNSYASLVPGTSNWFSELWPSWLSPGIHVPLTLYPIDIEPPVQYKWSAKIFNYG